MRKNIDPVHRQAQKQVNKKKGFYIHLGVYIVVGIFFLLMNLLTSPGDWWFMFPMLSWGVGLAIHYLIIFGLPGTDILSKEWEQRELEQELFRRGYYRKEEEDLPALPAETRPEEEELDLDPPKKIKKKQERWEEDEFV